MQECIYRWLMKCNKQLVGKFFIRDSIKDGICFIENPIWNYLSFILGGIGLLSCIQNQILLAAATLVTVFLLMNVKMISYYKIYRLYQGKQYTISMDGSKYSYTNPKKLIIRRQ